MGTRLTGQSPHMPSSADDQGRCYEHGPKQCESFCLIEPFKGNVKISMQLEFDLEEIEERDDLQAVQIEIPVGILISVFFPTCA